MIHPCVAADDNIYVIGQFDGKSYLQKFNPGMNGTWEARIETMEADDDGNRIYLHVDTENGLAYYYNKKIYIFNGETMYQI